MNRRKFLQIAGLTTAGIGLTGCAQLTQRIGGRKVPAGADVPPRTGSDAHRVWNRIGFGAIPGDHERFADLGFKAILEEQLNPTAEDDLVLGFMLSRLDVNRMHPAELRDLPADTLLAQLRQSAVLSAVYSKWQLRERLVEFWSNHFNIYALKGDGTYRKGADTRDVIRKHAMGSFPEMVLASAKSAAMLGYLDNAQNTRQTPNENYARELLELHTLGVHGGYSQKDVYEVARCFTGWTVEDRFLRARESFRFDASQHDDGEKKVLGQRIPRGGGVQDGERVIQIVTQSESCARFLATKLCRIFLGNAEENVVRAASNAYLQSKGQIKPMLEVILKPELLLNGEPIPKRPFDFAVSAIRALNAQTDASDPLQDHLAKMGQPLYGWPMPDGYPDAAQAWTGSMLARWNFAWDLAHGEIGGTRADYGPLAGKVSSFILGEANRGGNGPLDAAMALASPEFQWR